MPDLTIGEIGVVLQVNLVSLDTSVNPPTQVPLDLTGATGVTLSYVITDPNARPQAPVSREMFIVDAPNGIVQYTFVDGDLVLPANMTKNGVFRYSIEIEYSNGNLFVTNQDGLLTIKDDSIL